MRSLRYLNAILTLMAILLTLHLWTLWTGGPWGPAAVAGQGPTFATPAEAAVPRSTGLPNATIQRKQMVDLLKLQNKRTNELIRLLKSGKVRVKVDLPKERGED